MRDTRIRWADETINSFTGCTRVSPGCDHCYAEVLTTRYGPNSTAFPNGFTPTVKAHKLREFAKSVPRRIFTNSLSDPYHEAFTRDEVDAFHDAMLDNPHNDYMVLTKRSQRMVRYFNGADGWLARRRLTSVPAWMWLGASVENNRYRFRADHLREIDVVVRFLSCEPLIGPLPDLDLTGIGWVICGGESGNRTKDFRKMDLAWAHDLRERSARAGVAFFFKQDSGFTTELRMDALGELVEEFPFEHPAVHNGVRQLGVWPFAHAPASSSPVKVRK